MSNCPASDKIQNAIIPELSCNNPAPESILRLPTALPGVVGAGDLETDYQLTAADVNAAWTASYYQVSSNGVTEDTNTTVCVDNTAVDYDTFTWVDWLSPAQALEKDREWIKQLECSIDGGSNGLTFGPVRPPAARQPIVSLPMPSVTVNKYNEGGGGGGDKPSSSPDLAFQLVVVGDNSLQIRPGRVYVHGTAPMNAYFQYGNFDAADDCVKKGNALPVSFGSDGIYAIIGYVKYSELSIDSFGAIAATNDVELDRLPNVPGFFSWVIGRVSRKNQKLTVVEQEDCSAVFATSYWMRESFSLYFSIDFGSATDIKSSINDFEISSMTMSGGSIYAGGTLLNIEGVTETNVPTTAFERVAYLNLDENTITWEEDKELASGTKILIAHIDYRVAASSLITWRTHHPADILGIGGSGEIQIGVVTSSPPYGGGPGAYRAITLKADGTWTATGNSIPIIFPAI